MQVFVFEMNLRVGKSCTKGSLQSSKVVLGEYSSPSGTYAVTCGILQVVGLDRPSMSLDEVSFAPRSPSPSHTSSPGHGSTCWNAAVPWLRFFTPKHGGTSQQTSDQNKHQSTTKSSGVEREGQQPSDSYVEE